MSTKHLIMFRKTALWWFKNLLFDWFSLPAIVIHRLFYPKCTSIFLKTFHGPFCMLNILANAFGTITITISTIIINFQRVLSVTTGWRYAARCKKQRWKHYGGNTARGTYFLSHLSNRLYDDVELIVCVWFWQHYGANTARGTYCFLSNLNF